MEPQTYEQAVIQWIEDERPYNDVILRANSPCGAISLWYPPSQGQDEQAQHDQHGWITIAFATCKNGTYTTDQQSIDLSRANWAEVVKWAVDKFGFDVTKKSITTTVVTVE